MNHSPYLNKALNDLPGLLKRSAITLTAAQVEFDAIVCTGVSGMLVGPALAVALGKRLAIIRKKDDKMNHATVEIESGMEPDDRWIFVDDIIASGRTATHVMERMGKAVGGECAGYYMYNWDEYYEGD